METPALPKACPALGFPCVILSPPSSFLLLSTCQWGPFLFYSALGLLTGLFMGAALRVHTPLHQCGSIKSLHRFQHRVPQVLQLGQTRFCPGNEVLMDIFQPARKAHSALALVGCSPRVWTRSETSVKAASTLAGRGKPGSSALQS